MLEGRRYPYEGSYRVIARDHDRRRRAGSRSSPSSTATTGCASPRPPRPSTSKLLQAYTLPAFELSFRALRPGVVRLYQRYTVPKTVKLSAPTLFYLGPRKAKRASLRKTAKLKRTKAGPLHVAGRRSRCPTGWHGAFRYASCFRASPGTGHGRPGARSARS